MDRYAIIIVTYNRKSLLKECVTNALNQTVSADKIVIVNNASTDGTTEYLKTDAFKDEIFEVIHCDKNIGGAGGFYRGMKAALKYDIDWMLVIDDDAILRMDYVEKVFIGLKGTNGYQAAAGIVMTNGCVDKHHRRRLSRYGMLLKPVDDICYKKAAFACDIASFCGMLVRKDLIVNIGLPHAEYFIFHDDTEYSIRILKHSKFFIVTDAILDHKTKLTTERLPRRYTWKDYYEIRNRLLYVREHGNIFDIAVNGLDIFINKVFRNWVFAILRKDNYNWKYECRLVKKAIKNAKSGELENVIIKRES